MKRIQYQFRPPANLGLELRYMVLVAVRKVYVRRSQKVTCRA